MAELYRVLAPGGQVLWSAPYISPVHGVPDDFWRYTPRGAAALAEDAGFALADLWFPGGLEMVAQYLLGANGAYWPVEEMLREDWEWPLQVYMLLEKPPT